jgi:hypothetical protein
MKPWLPCALLAVAASACTADVAASDELTAPDAGGGVELAPAVDDGYVPHALTATRFGVLYQVSDDVLATYQDATRGLPQSANHAWIISQSEGDAHATRPFADLVHTRGDFYYAPAFDLWNAYPTWQTASDAELRAWGHAFRDDAIAAHADLFSFNEAPTTTGASAKVRARIATILRALHDPDARGRRLWGVVYLTEAAGTPASYTDAASDFFSAIDETSIALVVEHYHSNSFVCGQSTSALATHYFALHDWLLASKEPAKISIANAKFTVLHSARFAAGPSAWQGGNASAISLADFQRDLSRAAMVTRDTDGGFNRLAFGPVSSAITEPGVQPRITALFRWHYAGSAPDAGEAACIAGAAGNCACD